MSNQTKVQHEEEESGRAILQVFIYLPCHSSKSQ